MRDSKRVPVTSIERKDFPPEYLLDRVEELAVKVYSLTNERDELEMKLAAVTAERDELKAKLDADRIVKTQVRLMRTEGIDEAWERWAALDPSVGTALEVIDVWLGLRMP